MQRTVSARPLPGLPALLAGVLLGTMAQLHQRELMPVATAVALLAVAGLVAAVAMVAHWRWRPLGAWHRLSPWLHGAALLIAAAAAAFAGTTWRAHERLAERLPAALEGRDIEVTGVVAQLPRASLQGVRFVFEVEAARLDGAAVRLPSRLSLAWYRAAEPDALLLGPEVAVRAGQRWRFTVRLRQPHGSFNPGGFDLELWLFERGLGATGSVRSRAGEHAVLLQEAAAAPVERLRQHVRDAIERRLRSETGPGGLGGLGGEGLDVRGGAVAGVIAALAIGDQAAIEREDWELFRITGVAHLMSISGLHVTMFAWLAAAVIGWLWRRSTRAMLAVPAPLAARWGGVVVAALYALVAGWGVPAQRTVWMLAVVALLQSLALRWPLAWVMAVAAVVVALVDPWALLQPGFWLSFVAVALLAASQPVAGGEEAAGPGAAPWRHRARTAVRTAVRQQAVATVGLAPLTLVFFQQMSLVGFAANLVAIPWVTLVITPLALLGALLPPAWDVAALALAGLMAVLQWLGSWPHAVWQAAAAPGWAMAAGLLGGLMAVLPLPWRLRMLALPLMLPLLAPAVARPPHGQFELVALDVGQGTAVLVRTRHHLLLYDTGPAFSPQADAGSRLVVPLLHRRGERQIDLLMLSHRDTDHVGGAAAVLNALPVRRVSSSLEPGHPLAAVAARRGAAWGRCEAGQRWQWDGVAFEVLHPLAADYAGPEAPVLPRPNVLSCVLRVSALGAPQPQGGAWTTEMPPGGNSNVPSSKVGTALLTGDIEAAQEAALLARAANGGPALAAQLLLVPHHGSRTSSTEAFLAAVAPEQAFSQAGYRSRFGHPAAEVVARYEARGIALARSDRCGALTLSPGQALRCEREAARRYWHHRPAPR